MQRDVHLVNLESAQVDLRHPWGRRTEHDVRQLGGDHRAAPTVGQAGPQAVEQDVRIVAVDAHVGPMEHLDVLAVDPARRQAKALPPVSYTHLTLPTIYSV